MEKLWDKQTCESLKAYNAFIAYLKMGHKRSIRKVSQSLGYSNDLKTFSQWSVKYEWVKRVTAYDIEEFENFQKEVRIHSIDLIKSTSMIFNEIPKEILRRRSDIEKIPLVDLFNMLIKIVGGFAELIALMERESSKGLAELDDEENTGIVGGDELNKIVELIEESSSNEKSGFGFSVPSSIRSEPGKASNKID